MALSSYLGVDIGSPMLKTKNPTIGAPHLQGLLRVSLKILGATTPSFTSAPLHTYKQEAGGRNRERKF